MSAYKDAIELYVQALKQTPEGIPPLTAFGNALLEHGNAAQAVDILSLAVQENGDALSYRILGNAQEAADSNDAALASYKKAREFDKRNFDTHVAMGKLYKKMSRLSEAVQAFNAALNVTPDASDVLFQKAECFISLNDVDNARKIYQTLKNLGNADLARKLEDSNSLIAENGSVADEPVADVQAMASTPEVAPVPPAVLEQPAEPTRAQHPAVASRNEILARLKEYKARLKNSPYDPEIYFEMGTMLNQIDRPKDALQAFNLALRFDSSHAAAKYEKGVMLHALGKTDDAKAIVLNLQETGQEKLAEMLAERTGAPTSEAEDAPVQASPEPPAETAPEPMTAPATVSEPKEAEQNESGSRDDIIAKAKAALKANPFDSGTYLRMGKAYHAAGNQRDALTAFNLAIRFTPTMDEAKYYKALLLIDQGKTDDARAIYEAIKDSAPDEMKTNLVQRLGIGDSNSSSPFPAVETPAVNETANQVADPAPPPLDEPPNVPTEVPPPPPHSEPALAPRDIQTELEESKEEIKKNPYDPKAYLRLGLAYEQVERYSDALKGFNLALQFSPDLSVATYHKGICYLRMGDEEQALQEYTKLREEGHSELAQKLNEAFQNNGDEKKEEPAAAKEEPPPKYGIESDPENVIEACKKVIKQDPYDPQAYHKMGQAYKNLEKYQEAINAFSLAVKANGEFYEADYERGLCHLKLGEEEKALQVYTTLLKDGQKELAKNLFDLFLKRLK